MKTNIIASAKLTKSNSFSITIDVDENLAQALKMRKITHGSLPEEIVLYIGSNNLRMCGVPVRLHVAQEVVGEQSASKIKPDAVCVD